MIDLNIVPPDAGIRRIGFAVCFEYYRQIYGKYPQNSIQFKQVTTSIISEKRFQKYAQWWTTIKHDGGQQHGKTN